jgi:hypothetical protein
VSADQAFSLLLVCEQTQLARWRQAIEGAGMPRGLSFPVVLAREEAKGEMFWNGPMEKGPIAINRRSP